MAAYAGSVPRLIQAIITSHTQCNAWARKNFEFMFQLMTAALLNTKGFQNLKYCITVSGTRDF